MNGTALTAILHLPLHGRGKNKGLQTFSQSWYQFTDFGRMEGCANLSIGYNTPLARCTTNDR